MKDGRQTILAVDDSTANIDVLYEILGNDHELLAAASGEEALKVADAQGPDLILLDIMMPGLDGYETCSRLKGEARTSAIPVIFITALGSEADEARGLEAGAVDYIVKPFSPPIVKARVRTHLELKRQRDILNNLAFLDGLTGIPNRRLFDSRLKEEWRRAARRGETLALALMDVDFFKRYNDGGGHLAGDDCLRKVAATVASAMKRPGDLAARYGGEEFVCLLPDTNIEGARQVAERARKAVDDLRLPHPDSPAAPHVTLSVGIAAAAPTPDSGPTALVAAADRMLYAAKSDGRNRVSGHALER